VQKDNLSLFDAWGKNPFEKLAIAEIMAACGKKSKPWVFNQLNAFVKEGLVVKERRASLDVYGLNWENPFLTKMLAYVQAKKNMKFPKMGMISELVESIPVKNYVLLVFGSYADGTHKKDSDIDVCFLVDAEKTENLIAPIVKNVKLTHAEEIHEHYVTFSEFAQMLLRKEENLGKQIFKKSVLFHNTDIYYGLLKDAYRRGWGRQGTALFGKGQE